MEQSAQIPLLQIDGLSKRFPGAIALADVSLSIHAGQVHGLVGENGAGKSTLMKVLAGIERGDSGRVVLSGKPVAFENPADAQASGIAMIHQETNLVDDLTVAENIFLGREPTRWGFVNRRRLHEAARGLLKQVDAGFGPAVKVRTLSIAERQLVEIAKAISFDARLLIMDEPTAVLTSHETQALFELIGRLKDRGVTIIYISHLLPEVLRLCDKIIVMRDGRVTTTLDEKQVPATTEQELAGLMVGRPLADHFPTRSAAGQGHALEVRDLSVAGCVYNVSFVVRRGEIIGFAGLIGAGRTEMAEAIMGLRQRSSGVVMVDGKGVDIRSARDAVRAGIGYLSEDRKGTGLHLAMSVAANVTMLSLARYCRPLIHQADEDNATRGYIDRLRIRASGPRRAVGTLSGGNQQKVLLAKWLEMNPKILIVDEPTRGVDIGAKEEIYALLRRLVDEGMACMLISSELNEVLGLSHRVAVMRQGRLEIILNAADATEQKVMHYAAGVAVA